MIRSPRYLPLLQIPVTFAFDDGPLAQEIGVPSSAFLRHLSKKSGVVERLTLMLAVCEHSASATAHADVWRTLDSEARDFMRSIWLAAAVDIAGERVDKITVYETGVLRTGVDDERWLQHGHSAIAADGTSDETWRKARSSTGRKIKKGRERASLLGCWPWAALLSWNHVRVQEGDEHRPLEGTPDVRKNPWCQGVGYTEFIANALRQWEWSGDYALGPPDLGPW